MSFELRPYQRQAVQAALNCLSGTAGNGLLVEPVGAGKSLIIANIVRELDAPALVFQPTKEILEQNAGKLFAYGFEPAIYSASLRSREVGQITLATIGSVTRKVDLFRDVRYVIVDEADLVSAKGGMYQAFLAELRAKVLGMTATPFRLSTDGYGGSILKFLTRTKPRVFTDVVHYTQIGDLQRQGFLTALVYHVVPGFDARKVALNTTGADFADRAVQRHFDEIGMRDKTRRVVERLLARGRKHVLVFTRFVEDAEDLARTVPGCAVVHGETPKAEREGILADFRSGAIPAVANCAVLTAGFDFPALDTVVLAHPTMSLRVYMQQVGRVVRPAPGKAEAWVVDMVGLSKAFGKVEDLVLRPGGKSGQQWEFVSQATGAVLTNRYMDGGKKARAFERAREGMPW